MSVAPLSFAPSQERTPRARDTRSHDTQPETAGTVAELRQRVQRMQGAGSGRSLPSLPGLHDVFSLQTGSAYAVDSATLALAMLAGPSAAGEWVGVVGAPDLGYEAAAGLGVDLDRTIVVPHPGEHWLAVTAALVDVASVVLVRPPAAVSEHQAERLRARLRLKDAALVCWGEWPRCQGRLRSRGSTWFGLGRGHGHLSGRELTVEVSRGGAPGRTSRLRLPGTGGAVRAAYGSSASAPELEVDVHVDLHGRAG